MVVSKSGCRKLSRKLKKHHSFPGFISDLLGFYSDLEPVAQAF